MTAGRTNINQTSQCWCTPPKYVKSIKDFFGADPDLDPCSNKYSIINAKVKYILPNQNGLIESWNFKTIFVNPPYGSDREMGTTIKDWISRCYNANKMYNSEVLALIPVATNTLHWKKFIFGKASCICFLYDTRLKFMLNGIIDEKGAPMSCAMIYWGKNIDKFIKVYSEYGAAINIYSSVGTTFGENKYISLI